MVWVVFVSPEFDGGGAGVGIGVGEWIQRGF